MKHLCGLLALVFVVLTLVGCQRESGKNITGSQNSGKPSQAPAAPPLPPPPPLPSK